MKLDALDHPKTLDLASRLEVELPTAIGHLELLWAFTGKKAPQGDIGKWPDGAIARACYWMTRPEKFLLALHESGFIEADDEHRLIIHDWPDHAPRWVKAKLAKLGLDFIRRTTAPTAVRTAVPTTGPPVEASSKGREDKRSEVKPKGARAREASLAAALATPGLDVGAFRRWEVYRRESLKPIRPASMEAAAQEMAALGKRQAEAVQHSMASGYQGLFPKTAGTNGNGHAQPPPKRERPPTADEIAEARRKAAAENAATVQKLGLGGALKALPS